MACWVALAVLWLNVVIIGAVPYPDAPLSVAYASLPLQTKSSVPAPAPQYTFQTFANNAAYTAQTPTSSNPALLVAAPNPANTAPNFINFYSQAPGQPQRVFASPARSAPQGTIVQFVPAQDSSGVQAQRVTSPQRNFVTITRGPPQQFIPPQSPTEPQFLGQRALFVAAPLQANEQSSAVPNQLQVNVPRQFGIRTAFTSPGPSANFASVEQAAAGGGNPVPSQPFAVRRVVISPRQSTLQSPQGDSERRATPLPQPLRPRTVFLGSPNQATEQSLPSNPAQPASASAPAANLVSSSQFFSRNFGNTGTVTYFFQPLAVPAGGAPIANRPGADVEA